MHYQWITGMRGFFWMELWWGMQLGLENMHHSNKGSVYIMTIACSTHKRRQIYVTIISKTCKNSGVFQHMHFFASDKVAPQSSKIIKFICWMHANCMCIVAIAIFYLCSITVAFLSAAVWVFEHHVLCYCVYWLAYMVTVIYNHRVGKKARCKMWKCLLLSCVWQYWFKSQKEGEMQHSRSQHVLLDIVSVIEKAITICLQTVACSSPLQC